LCETFHAAEDAREAGEFGDVVGERADEEVEVSLVGLLSDVPSGKKNQN
jgi:hypothetical protein